MLVDLQRLRDTLVQLPVSNVAATVGKWDIPSTLKLPDGFVIRPVAGLKSLTPEEQLEVLVEIRTGRDLDAEESADLLCDKCFSPLNEGEPCTIDHEVGDGCVTGPLLDWIPIYEGLHEWESARIFVCANPASIWWGYIGLDNNDSHGRRGFNVVTDSLEEILRQYTVIYDRYVSQQEIREKIDHVSDREVSRICKEYGIKPYELVNAPLTTLRDEKGFGTYFG